MSNTRSLSVPDVPRWLAIPVTVLLTLHLGAVGLQALAAPSGPWITPMGPSMAEPPAFAGLALTRAGYPPVTIEEYLRALKMTHNYHFTTNRTAMPGAKFEVKLKDEKGKVFKTLEFPDRSANLWVRHRQLLLAQGLANDEPVQVQGEVVAGPGGQMPTIDIWDFTEGQQTLGLKRVEQHKIPRDRPAHMPVMKPSPWSLILADSYKRHLCREHGAASAVLVRKTKDAIYPAYALMDALPPMTTELVTIFGEVQK